MKKTRIRFFKFSDGKRNLQDEQLYNATYVLLDIKVTPRDVLWLT